MIIFCIFFHNLKDKIIKVNFYFNKDLSVFLFKVLPFNNETFFIIKYYDAKTYTQLKLFPKIFCSFKRVLQQL